MSLAAALLLVATGSLAGTTVVPLDEAALAARSDLIARVVVTGAHAERVGRRVFTFYEADVVDAWRSRDASAPARVVVALPGGVVDGIGQHVAGVPVLEVGRQYVLCLGDDDGPPARGGKARGIVGFWQGAFAVVDAGKLRAFTHGPPTHPPPTHPPPAHAAPPLVDEGALRARLGGAR